MELETRQGETPDAIDLVNYFVVRAQLSVAGAKLRGLADQVTSTYSYVERCAEATDRRAEQMAALSVDSGTVAVHHDAAAMMRAALDRARAMAAALDALSAKFSAAAAEHEADYGPVADAARGMPVRMADASFYANR